MSSGCQPFGVLLPPIAHIALYRHGVIRGDFVALDGPWAVCYTLQFGLGLRYEHLDDLSLVLAIAHRGEHKVSPGIKLFVQALEMGIYVADRAKVRDIQHFGAQALDKIHAY